MRLRGRHAAIADAVTSTEAWRGVADGDWLRVLEDDVRGLLRDAAGARGALEERESEHRHEVERVLLSFLDVTDAFDRVFSNIEGGDTELVDPVRSWVGNFRMVDRLLRSRLASQGVEPIEDGGDFDPDIHLAVDTIPGSADEADRIVKVVKPGYRWRDTVLRRAEVVVVRADDARELER
jgi:molecular chaperone GrpE (heat shock protein)